MSEKIDTGKYEVINFKNLFNILVKRKKLFFYTGLIVLVLSLCITFLIPKEYGSKSIITISSNFYYGELLSKYFPEEFDKLWIISENNIKDSKINRLNSITEDLKSDSIQEEVIAEIGNTINKNDLKKAIELENTGSSINLTIYTVDPNLSYKINKTLIEVYNNKKNVEFNIIYPVLLKKLNEKINIFEKEMTSLSKEAENYNLDFYSKLLKNMEKSGDNTVYFSTGHFISPELQAKINSNNLEFYQLSGIKQSLMEDKGLYLNRIKVLSEPKIEDIKIISNLVRNITLSVITSILIGLAAVFIVNHFKN